MTVWIVAQGSRGMSLSKSRYRLAGTFAGAAVAVALIAVFAQTPELLFLALAAWVGFCTATSTALRNFRSYGAVLAGYTAAIISVAASANPSGIFDIAVARVTCISLGVITEAAFNGVFAPEHPFTAVRKSFLAQAAGMAARALRGEDNRAEVRVSSPWRSNSIPRANMRPPARVAVPQPVDDGRRRGDEDQRDEEPAGKDQQSFHLGRSAREGNDPAQDQNEQGEREQSRMPDQPVEADARQKPPQRDCQRPRGHCSDEEARQQDAAERGLERDHRRFQRKSA
jgi:hypothetical protein